MVTMTSDFPWKSMESFKSRDEIFSFFVEATMCPLPVLCK